MGNLVARKPTFSSGIKALADYVHNKGLKLGIYGDSGGQQQSIKPRHPLRQQKLPWKGTIGNRKHEKKQVHRDLKEAMYKQEGETHGNCNRNHEKKGQPYLGDAVQKGETLEEEKRQR
ncbi:hypothetical protein E3N88_05578 [Mikania micrantha]|uniref:Alpha-galactosidase n=1 Tax=Mikania micrantha TaxID=192012 RepID=A0A5N6PM29_9ASTR|nr:hypothetical protein E3N88_05578 [Mikania micrantha]